MNTCRLCVCKMCMRSREMEKKIVFSFLFFLTICIPQLWQTVWEWNASFIWLNSVLCMCAAGLSVRRSFHVNCWNRRRYFSPFSRKVLHCTMKGYYSRHPWPGHDMGLCVCVCVFACIWAICKRLCAWHINKGVLVHAGHLYPYNCFFSVSPSLSHPQL